MFSAKMTLKVDINPLNLAKRMRKESERALFRAGSKLRGIMRRQIRPGGKKGKNSAPGESPRYHTAKGEFGLRSIVFKVDTHSLSLRVGPILESSKDLPGLLEKGGIASFRVSNGRITSLKRARNTKFIRYRMSPRPFASTALKAFKSQYPEEWRNVIK